MQYFLDTVETIPDGVGFARFGPVHLAWLAGGCLFALAACLLYRRLGPAGRALARRSFAAALLADEAFKTVLLLAGSNYMPKYLPLHLCSINILLIAIHALHPGKTLDNFLYVLCLPTALAALLFPTWTALPPANFMHIHSFTVHILLVVYPLMLTAGGDIRPDVRRLPRCLGLLAALAAVALGANLAFGTNFMFLMYAEPGNPLMWFQTHWGSHLWGFPVLGAAAGAAMYLPWAAARRLKRKKRR